ncbi:hypothetical protein [Ralstonia solanacearum]|uniref:hypothetical protein n=1 Tax=Ralstonia solanacearum TaxID=305 RepID=UPI0036063064
MVIGLASDPASNSVVVWDEGGRYNSRAWTPLDRDGELFSIDGMSRRFATAYWGQLIGLTVTGMTILKKAQMSAKERTRPSELGLRMRFGDGSTLIASHGLHNGSDDFSVLEESDLGSIELHEHGFL